MIKSIISFVILMSTLSFSGYTDVPENDFLSGNAPLPVTTAAPEPMQPASAPQGNCPDCNGTGHHNDALCGTCNGTGTCVRPNAPQGNCPDCDGTGHHNDALCGTCGGTGYYVKPTAPQTATGGCHSHNRYQNSGHHGGHH